MDWVEKALELKQDCSWAELPDKVYELTGEIYSADKIRAACRRRMAKVDTDPIREGSEERTPKISESDGNYVITTGSKVVGISKETLRELKRLYCTRPYPTMNDCARKLNIPRRDIFTILKAFQITHDDVPYIDEDLIEREIEDLAFETLEFQKQQYFDALDRLEINELRKEIKKFRKEEYFLELIDTAVSLHMKEFNKKYRGPRKSIVVEDHEYMLEIPIVDLHLGKLSWAPETGEHYDYKIARQRYHFVIDDIYTRAKQKKIAKILFPISNDFFHTDTTVSTTAAGTFQDSDLRWTKLYSVGVEMLVQGIDKFREIAPVEVLVVPGNHDRMTGYYAVKYLDAWYRCDEDVNVHVDPKTRKYFEYGACLIGYSHGNKERGRIWSNMPNESPKAWGRTRYREFHLAHLHKEEVQEEHGIKVRRLSSVTGTDSWHFEEGYVGAQRMQQTFLWHKDLGLHEIWQTPI